MNAVNAVAEVKNLRVEVDGRAIADGVDLRVLPGTVTALVGASGSGKTTTGLALLGEYPAGAHVSGHVRVPDGLVGHVPQHPAALLNPARRIGAPLGDIARAQVRHLPRRGRAGASALTAGPVSEAPAEASPHGYGSGTGTARAPRSRTTRPRRPPAARGHGRAGPRHRAAPGHPARGRHVHGTDRVPAPGAGRPSEAPRARRRPGTGTMRPRAGCPWTHAEEVDAALLAFLAK